MSEKQVGPHASYTCYRCRFHEVESFRCQDDSGLDHYCLFSGERKYIGAYSGSTPDWCPVMGKRSVEPARPLDEWHEDHGDVVWWKFPVSEPAWIGRPLDDEWPGYHTHWTPHPPLPSNSDS